MISQLPAPQQICSADPWAKMLRCKLVVAAKAPFEILATSRPLRDALDITAEQFSARTLSMICGPETDIQCLTSAIKSASIEVSEDSCKVLTIKIYGREGAAHQVRVTCTIHEKSDDGAAISCCLHFETARAENSSKARALNMEPHFPAHRRGSMPSTPAEYRARYNVLTGLEMERDLRAGLHCQRPRQLATPAIQAGC